MQQQKEVWTIKRGQHNPNRDTTTRTTTLIRWDPNNKYLASCGANRRVFIWNRNGEAYDEFAMTGPKAALQIEWDRDGQTLAVLQDGHNTLLLYSLREKSVKEIDLVSKEPSFMTWSKTSQHLAVGTSKGNVIIYDHATKKLTTHQGKHSKSGFSLINRVNFHLIPFFEFGTGVSSAVRGIRRIGWLWHLQTSSYR